MEAIFGWLSEICPAAYVGHDALRLDLAAQQQMACWAAWMTLATAVGVIVSGFAVFGVFVSLRQTRAAIRDNRRLGEAQTRAYVQVAGARHAWTDAGYGLILEVVNVGETPARIFEVGGHMQKVAVGQVSRSIRHSTYEMKRWSSLGPGGSPTTVRLDTANPELIREFRRLVPDHVLLVNGVVRYQDVYDQWFETEFAFYSYTAETGFINGHTKLRRPTASLRAYEPVPAPPRYVAPSKQDNAEVNPFEAEDRSREQW